ncbi:MAG TPA: transcription termination factor NusA [Anaerolineaceae bacterium]
MKNEFVLAFNEVLEEKQLPREVIMKALESAMVSAYRRAVNASTAQQVEAKVDLDTGKVTIYAEKEVVEAVQDPRTEVNLVDACRVNPSSKIGDMVVVESTPRDFGRVAAQTARQVIQQRIRDAERQAQLSYYEKQIGEIISGLVQAVNAQGLTIGLEMRAEGLMPRKEMIGSERFRVHDRVRALVSEVKDSPRGPQIILSRTHRNFLRRLLENEVPEIYHGIVEIRSIAREPGERAKVAVSATQAGIDPVGACVGIRGVRIQAIVRELHDEKIDVIEWNNDPAVFISKALSPARVVGVYLNEKNASGKTATVVVPEDQLSLAIGRDGQNARLAAKLTNWRIDIKSVPEAASDAFAKIKADAELAQVVQVNEALIERISVLLAKKAENRPLTPEEYDSLAQFVDRVEKRSAGKRQAEKKEIDTRVEDARKQIPAFLFDQNILDSTLPEHVSTILQGAGFLTTGDLVLQAMLNPDSILRLQGIGPRSMQEITRLVETVTAPPSHPPVETEAVPPLTIEKPVEPSLIASEVSQPTGEAILPSEEQTTEPVGEKVSTETVEPTQESETEPGSTEVEEETTFDKIFTLRPELIPTSAPVDDEEEEDSTGKKEKKKGKKKRRSVEVEYDPDRDMTIVHKKHKRGEDWSWDE